MLYGVWVCQRSGVEAGGHLHGGGSLLPTFTHVQGSNSGHQACVANAFTYRVILLILILVWFLFLRQSFTVWSRMAWHSPHSCASYFYANLTQASVFQ